MKVFPLRVGRTKVPFGQFYSGLDGYSLIKRIGDQDFIWVPIHAYLIEHPAGPILVDAAISPEQTAHSPYYDGTLIGQLRNEDEFDLPDGQTMEAQLARHGYRLEDIRTVIITHLHEDHVGSLRRLPHAEVVLGRREYDERDSMIMGLLPHAHQKSIELVQRWRPVDFSGPPIDGFNASEDLLGDGRVVLLPTPGHSPGSTSVLVRLDDHEVLLTGDAMYTILNLAVDDLRAMQTGAERTYVDSIRRIQWLHRKRPNLLIMTAHDHTEYGAYVAAAMSEGHLSVESREWVRNYLADTFDAEYGLNPAKIPEYRDLSACDEVDQALRYRNVHEMI